MAEKTEVLTEKDDDAGEALTIVEVDKLPAPGEKPAAAKVADDKGEDDDHGADDDEGDRRLSAEDDEPADGDTATRRKRLKRRQAQRAAREATFNRLSTLENQNRFLMQRLGMVEGATLNQSEQQVDGHINTERENIDRADRIIAKAIEMGNGVDAAQAMRLRDEARDRLLDLQQTKRAIAAARETGGKEGQGKDPGAAGGPRQEVLTDSRTISHAQDWAKANAWYNPNGQDTDSKLVNRIDREIAAEGFDPRSREYWRELTKRVQEELSEDGVDDTDDVKTRRGADDRQGDRGDDKGGRQRGNKGPPMSAGRGERGGQLGKNEVYVTPEQKAAMIEGGYWDDPKKRARMLKRYQEQQRTQSAR